MATDPVPGLYRRYKIGTNHIVSWLSNTTLQRMDSASIMPCLKHLAISRGKRTAKQELKSKPSQAPDVTRLSTQNLLELSRALATAANRKQQPPKGLADTILILEDVIAGRKECSRWYARKTNAEDSATQAIKDGHSAFVYTLSQVLIDLKVASQKARQPQQQFAPHSPSQQQKLANIYQTLYVENSEHSAHQSDSRGAKPTKPTKSNGAPNQVFRLEQSRDKEQAFALWCLLAECYKIREHVKEVWIEQQSGTLTAKVASQVTTFAVLLSADLVNEFIKDFPDLATFDKIAEYLHIRASISGPQIEEFSCNNAGSAADNGLSMTSISELVCLQAINGLSIIRRHQDARANDRGTLDASFSSLAANPWFVSVGFCVPELNALKTEKGRFAALGYGDAFTQLLVEFVSYKRATLDLLLVIAFQMQIDIHGVVNLNDTCEHMKFRFDVELVQISAEEYETFLRTSPHAHHHEPGSQGASQRKEVLRRINKSISSPPRDALAAARWQLPGSTRMSPLYMHSPVLVGHMSSMILQMYYQSAMSTCNEDIALTAMVHLYRACRVSGQLDVDWEDMEFVIAQHGPEAFGLPAIAPRNMERRRRIFAAAMGVEGSERREKKVTKENHMRALPPLAATLKQSPKLAAVPHFADVLQPYIDLQKQLPFHEAHVARQALAQLAFKIATTSEIMIEGLPKHDSRGFESLPNTQLLRVLKVAMAHEELCVKFDHHAMLRDCNLIFDRIVAQGLVPGGPGPVAGSLPHEITHGLLWEASQADEGDKGAVRNVSVASWVLDQYIRQTGDINLIRAEWSLSSNVIPSSLQPNSCPDTREREAAKYQYLSQGQKTSIEGAQFATSLHMTRNAEYEEMSLEDPEGALAAFQEDLLPFMTLSTLEQEQNERYREHMRRLLDSTPEELTAIMRGETRQKKHLQRIADGAARFVKRPGRQADLA